MKSSFQIVKHSMSWVWINKSTLLFVFTPFLVCLVITSFLATLSSLLYFLAFYILTWFFSTGMVQVHRGILWNEQPQYKLFPKPEKVYFKYFGLWLLISAIITVSDRVTEKFFDQLETNFNFGLLIFGILGLLFFYYLVTRAYFVFPSISIGNAIDKTFSFSRGKFWKTFRVLLIFIIPYIIFVIVTAILFFLAAANLVGDISSLLIFPFLFFYYFFSLMLYNILYSFMLKEFSTNDTSV